MWRTPTAFVATLALAAPLVPPSQAADPPDHRPVRGWSERLGAQVLTDGGVRLSHTQRFEMVGVTWRGREAPVVQVRTHSGTWTPWRELHELGEHAPDRGTGEGTQTQPRATELQWVGPSDGVQVRAEGGAGEGLRVVLIDPGTSPTDFQADTPPADVPPADAAKASERVAAKGVPRPRIRSRGRWNANPNWRDGSPRYSRTIKQAHVHHTAGSNSYSRGDVAGIIRGMYWYHTKQLGWSDLGYNFLVDRFGRRWVGRAGGMRRAVLGAHTLGFNRRSFGVAVMGNYETVRPSKRAVRSLVRLISWKMDRFGRNPAGRVRMRSSGSDLYPQGTYVRLPKIDGHRNTNQTACPGARLYTKLPGIRRRAQSRVDKFS
ncbi:MAG TPA: N-acetylmuramoyl-L-alanine amidase [Nocardioidaceae bacterium]|nr:N-acetylmuramoyl-L-alanine amidase [Nocardioidaceae bacterium]